MPDSCSKHTIVISDVHLCNAMPGDGLWLRYRQKRFFPDNDLASLFGLLLRQTQGDDVEIVFGGDLFDLDAPPIHQGDINMCEPPRTESSAVQAFSDILDDHDVFLASCGTMLASGHTMMFMSGNHDPQLVFPEVQKLLRMRIIEAAHNAGSSEALEDLSRRINFRTWFHVTDEGIHIEHGNQYDPYCSFRYPTEPFTHNGASIQPTLGSLAFRNLISKMGYLNPYNDAFVMMSVPKYIVHWAKYYFFTRRSLVLAWVGGSVKTFVTAWKSRTSLDEARALGSVAAYAAETGTDYDRARNHASLFARPSEDARLRVLHELGIDRMLLFALGICASVIVWGFYGEWAALKTMAGTFLAIVAYEVALSKKPILDKVYLHVDACQREIARIHDVRAIVFGHTHVPSGTWKDGMFIGNSGTWAPGFKDIECSTPLAKGRPLIWLRKTPKGKLNGGLYHFENGELRARKA